MNWFWNSSRGEAAFNEPVRNMKSRYTCLDRRQDQAHSIIGSASDGLVAVCECHNIEFLQFQNLKKLVIRSTGERESYDVDSKALHWCNNNSLGIARVGRSGYSRGFRAISWSMKIGTIARTLRHQWPYSKGYPPSRTHATRLCWGGYRFSTKGSAS
jgi:hypothetical protein